MTQNHGSCAQIILFSSGLGLRAARTEHEETTRWCPPLVTRKPLTAPVRARHNNHPLQAGRAFRRKMMSFYEENKARKTEKDP